MVYFAFKDNISGEVSAHSSSCLIRVVIWILTKFLPKSNPDFNEHIACVALWYIEFNEEENYAEREVGIDEEGRVIIKAPYLRNLGFWCDSDMSLDDFKRFPLKRITREEFEEKWRQ